IVREGPGACPICGMALEPMTVTADGADNTELKDMTQRMWIGAALSVPLVALEMGAHIPALRIHEIFGSTLPLIEFALATPVVLWAGWPFFQRGAASLVHRSLNMFTLIALGTGAAYLYSLAATFLPQLFPASMRDMAGNVPVYYEAAAVI